MISQPEVSRDERSNTLTRMFEIALHSILGFQRCNELMLELALESFLDGLSAGFDSDGTEVWTG